MTRTILALALGAAAALAGCNNKDHTIVAGPDTGQDANVGTNSDVQLPPPIAASKIYRCSGDNSVIYVDWLADDKTANVRTEQNGSPTQVTTAEAGKPLTGANGLIVTGTPSGASISVKLPEGATKTCRA